METPNLDQLVNLENWQSEYFQHHYASHFVCKMDFPNPDLAAKELAALKERVKELENKLQPPAPADWRGCTCEYVEGEYGGRIPNNDCPYHSPRR